MIFKFAKAVLRIQEVLYSESKVIMPSLAWLRLVTWAGNEEPRTAQKCLTKMFAAQVVVALSTFHGT